jgi:thiol:disulfide interchange protein
MPEVITSIENLSAFQNILQTNPGVVILKLGAEWCVPCKHIQPIVEHGIGLMPENVQCVVLDVDESFEVYAVLKKKRRVNGVPAILAWKQGNVSDLPDEAVVGADPDQVIALFNRCLAFAKNM